MPPCTLRSNSFFSREREGCFKINKNLMVVQDLKNFAKYFINLDSLGTTIIRKNNKQIIRDSCNNLQITTNNDDSLPISSFDNDEEESELLIRFRPQAFQLYLDRNVTPDFSSSFHVVDSFWMLFFFTMSWKSLPIILFSQFMRLLLKNMLFNALFSWTVTCISDLYTSTCLSILRIGIQM